MSELGISIYPSKSSFQEMAAYLDQTASLGYTRIFTSMLEVADNPDETVKPSRPSLLMAISSACGHLLMSIPSSFRP